MKSTESLHEAPGQCTDLNPIVNSWSHIKPKLFQLLIDCLKPSILSGITLVGFPSKCEVNLFKVCKKKKNEQKNKQM